MISKLRSKPVVAKSISRSASPLRRAPSSAAKRIGGAVSSFQASASKGAGKPLEATRKLRERKEALADFWHLRSALQKKDKGKALEQARKIADRLHVAIGSGAKTAKQVLTLIGRQVISPDFNFTHPFQVRDIFAAAYRPGGRAVPNDPDPTAMRV
ncbi:MAG: hypothetical protein AB1938_12145 [Myxococcota bacterium]